MELAVGNKAWSTWTMRPWLVLKRVGVEFTEHPVQLRQGEATAAAIAQVSPSGQVPSLKDGDLLIWDSLAICEYLAEKFPQHGLWPADPARRALARSATAEMHAGFSSLRGECPMDLRAEPHVAELSEATHRDLRRMARLWSDLLGRFGGPYLGGPEWGIVDAYFTPVATRLRTYGVRLSDYGDAGAGGAYAQRLLERPEFRAWEAEAIA